jgi:RimJ/RimL family protein N-acetyltransferase
MTPGSIHELRTPRLVLRAWRPEDRAPFAAMNADPPVMAHFPHPLDRAQSDGLVDRIEAHFAEHGWGLWAVEVVDGPAFIGFLGLARPNFEPPCGPCVEVGWRLAHSAWGHGYAPEGGAEALRFAFDDLGLDEVVSFTTTLNANSRRVMTKLGLTHDPADDFDHPNVSADWSGRRHVLYRIDRTRWLTTWG